MKSNDNKVGLTEAISIGIGGMVGGGIFAVLGLAVALAQGGTPVSFLFAGIIALITCYSYVKLSVTFPDRGGTVHFINKGFEVGVFSGAMNNLLWISYIIMLSLYASAFGSYAPNLYSMTGNVEIDTHIYATLIVIISTAINYYSISMVGKIENWAVVIKLIILIAFAIIGSFGLIGNENLHQLDISHWETPIQLITAGMVIFVAYEGFELIANTAVDIRNPLVNIPRAYYFSVIFVIVLYVIITIVTIGSLPFSTIATSQDYVLAEAAKPMLGQMGFTIITIAALLSTFSAINASLYGGSQVNYEIAVDKESPQHLATKLWKQPIGLMVTAILTLIVTNTLDLEDISIAGSIGFLIIFSVVNLAGYHLSKYTGGNRFIALTGALICFVALIVMVMQQFESNQLGILISIGIIVTCFISEFMYRKYWR